MSPWFLFLTPLWPAAAGWLGWSSFEDLDDETDGHGVMTLGAYLLVAVLLFGGLAYVLTKVGFFRQFLGGIGSIVSDVVKALTSLLGVFGL